MSKPKYWQIASGARGRDYSDVFLRYGIACVGEGEREERIQKVSPGDRVILKSGRSEIIAVGQVVERDGKWAGAEDKEWLHDFDGWDLDAYCYVEWRKPPKPIAVKGLNMGSICAVNKPHLRELVEKLIVELDVVPVTAEPEATSPVTDDEILEFLITQGLRPGAAEELANTFKRIRYLAGYYHKDQPLWEQIREHETRTFLIVPLLLGLGWAEQQMKIEHPAPERGRIDIACFAGPYTRATGSEQCVLILESKGFNQGLHYAPSQAHGYAKHFPNCQVVVVSNGYCYKAYSRKDSDEFSEQPNAYLNLLRPRDRYPLDPENVDGCLEMLRLLLPQTWLRPG